VRMDEDIAEKAEAYATRRGSHLAGRLGFGIHGIVFTIEGNAQRGVAALKLHYAEEPHFRERDVYERLKEEGVLEIRAFRVPQLIGFDDELLALEMTVVKPPFVLDFAGAYLDFAPEFSDEIWEEWIRKNEEQFGANWSTAQMILDDLKDLGIHMHDPSPSNIRFK
jgi:hypothetical protein